MTWLILNVIASNLGSFALGMFACKRLGRHAAAAVDNIHENSEDSVNEKSKSRLARIVAVILVSALVFGLGVRTGYELLSDKVSCFNTYANKNADSQEIRSTATEALQAADARRDMAIVAALTPGHDTADIKELKAASAAKVAKQRELQRQRRVNPYPKAPREVC